MEYTQVNYFTTQNQQLAFALVCAGCQLAPQEAQGPAINTYTLGWLRQNKIGVGLPMEDAVRLAEKNKIPGIVQYIFVRDAALEDCIRHWDEMVEEFQAANHANRPPTLSALGAREIMQVLYVASQNRKAFKELPWFNSPMLSTIDGNSSEQGDKKMFRGRGKVWALDASPELKRQLRTRH